MQGKSREFYWTWEDAITESNLKPMTRLVLLTLSTFMNAKNTSAYPSQEELARCSGMGLSTVNRHLKLALEAGFIEVRKHGFSGQNWANNEYIAVIPSAEKVVSEGDDLFEKGSAALTERLCQREKKVMSERHTNKPINQSLIPLEEGTEVFINFWRAYPLTDGQNRNACKRLWDALSDQDKIDAVRCLPAYVKIMGSQSVSYPFVFLRDRIWMDALHLVDVVTEKPMDPPYALGTPIRALFDAIAQKYGRPTAWAWFGEDKARVDGVTLYASKRFIFSTWQARFASEIVAAGLAISFGGDLGSEAA